MPPIAELIQQGATNLWIFIPTAILLGALHGLEPGHSKTMMASFIIAVKGSVSQAALLGLCAAFSHSLIVWALAAAALKFGNELIAEQAEPYFMLLSAVVVIGVSIWMFVRTRRDELAAKAHQHAPHGGKIINTGHGIVELEVFEFGTPPRFRLHSYDAATAAKAFDDHDTVSIETLRPDGTKQTFDMKRSGMFLESTHEIPEPHEFEAVLSMGHGDHIHRFEVSFSEEDHDHAHQHHHHDVGDDLLGGDGSYQDAHERAHAEDIKRRFVGQKVTTGQIAMFGLTGGLVPCPASVTILMICLHLKRFTLGAVMVASFSLGLAISLVSVGVIAAWGARQVGKRFGNGKFSELARKMPYFSSGLMAVVAALMGIQALMQLAAN
ncbi:nickel/cobalt efflux transporter [Rhodoferax sp.]|uniref:nickel/cobalt efflux transporter n=1 Tax=Rhodoferax sp. TaxID=50421 RepID=UPI00284EEA38|nr:nickel/cobalt efflux transporter [Rhodoferax sp.]MDR3369272.1 nickel/cobalt efflux transporter [Rhodoferax sp.]